MVPAGEHPASRLVVSVFMQRVYGPRVPFAAAERGYFFRAFARLHPTEHFPHVSLLVPGTISVVSAGFS